MAIILLVALAVLLAIAVPALILGLAGSDQRITGESYDFLLVVQVTGSVGSAELLTPTPDFPELRLEVAVIPDLPGYNNTNVRLGLSNTSRGLMFSFAFSESFAAYGSVRTQPGTASATLTLSTQMSNRTWFFLSNVTGGGGVAVLLYYERIQFCCLRTYRHSFLGTSDPRSAPQTGLVVTDQYLQYMISDVPSYIVLSSGWNLAALQEGAFTTLL